MNIKYLLGSFLILLVAASAMTPVLGASNQNSSNDVKFVKCKLIEDAQWVNLTNEEKEAYLGQFEISDENGNIKVKMLGMPGMAMSSEMVTLSISTCDPDEMKLLESMNAEEREAYYLSRYKENLAIEVEAGNLTQEEADELYAEYASLEHNHVNFFTMRANTVSLSEEELEALKDMTEDEREAFFLENFKQSLSDAVAEGKLTQEEAGEMLSARENGINIGFKAHGGNGEISLRIASPLSEEEIITLQEMTEDDKKDFFLSQIKSSLDADVAAGKMTQEEADEILSYHESGSAGYTRGHAVHRTASYHTTAAAVTE